MATNEDIVDNGELSDPTSSVQIYLISRNVMIHGVRTSMRLEPDVWDGLADICRREKLSLHRVCTVIKDGSQCGQSLTSAVRTCVLGYYRRATTPDGHVLAGHGDGETAVTSALLPGSAYENRIVGSHHTVVNGFQHGREPIGDTELAEDVLSVELDTSIRNRKQV